MSNKDDRFKGGDSLSPGTLEHMVHNMLMRSELSGGRGAYRISNAVLANSGPSFGPFQYDLGANQDGRRLFESIAVNAKGEDGKRILDEASLGRIKQHLYRPFGQILANREAKETYQALRPAMNAALSSEAGQQLIHTDYIKHLHSKVDSLHDTIGALTRPTNRDFVKSSPLAQLIIIDTANQYGPRVNQKLRSLLDMGPESTPIPMPDRKPAEMIGVRGELGVEDLVRFKLETNYAQNNKGAYDTLRRISNLVLAVGPDRIHLSEEDRRFFAVGLKQYLKDNGRNPGILDNPELRPLKQLGIPHAHGQRVETTAPEAEPKLHSSIRGGVQALDRHAGKCWDESSNRLFANACRLATENGFKDSDDVQLALSAATRDAAAGTTLLVRRTGAGASSDPAANWAGMPMSAALTIAPDENLQRPASSALHISARSTQRQEQSPQLVPASPARGTAIS